MWHVCGRREINTEFWWGNLKEEDYMEDPDIERGIQKLGGKACTGFISKLKILSNVMCCT